MEKDEFNTSFQVQLLFEGEPAGGAARRDFSAMHRANVAFYERFPASVLCEEQTRLYNTAMSERRRSRSFRGN